MENSRVETMKNSNSTKLFDKWVLWAHLPHNTDWSLKSYTNIYTADTAEKLIALNNTLPEELIKNCMLFFMRDGILPMWEDPKNSCGGCFSFKINHKNVKQIWKNVSYVMAGETLSKNPDLAKNINGITISPKKSFSIFKIWVGTTKFQSVQILENIPGLSFQGCIFKKHKPDF